MKKALLAILYIFLAAGFVYADSFSGGGGTSGAGSGIVNSGTAGQIAVYPSNGTAVSGASCNTAGNPACTDSLGNMITKDSAGNVSRIDLYYSSSITDYGSASTQGSIAWAIAQFSSYSPDIWIHQGSFPVLTPIQLVSGTNIHCVSPNLQTSPQGYLADIYPSINSGTAGGTIFTTNGSSALAEFFTDNGSTVYGGSINDCSFYALPVGGSSPRAGYNYAIKAGAAERVGLYYVMLNHLYIQNPNIAGIELWNSAHVDAEGINVFYYEPPATSNQVWPTTWYGGLHFISQNDPTAGVQNIQAGNMTWTNLQVSWNYTGDSTARTLYGSLFETRNPASSNNTSCTGNGTPWSCCSASGTGVCDIGGGMSSITLIRPQVNNYGYTGTLAGSNRRGIGVLGSGVTDNGPPSPNVGMNIIGAIFDGQYDYEMYMQYTTESRIEFSTITGAGNQVYPIYTDTTDSLNTYIFPQNIQLYVSPQTNGTVQSSLARWNNGGMSAVGREPNQTLSAQTLLSSYGPDLLMTSVYNGATTRNLPQCRSLLGGHRYTEKRALVNQPISYIPYATISAPVSSTSSVTLGSGNKSFTVATGLNWIAGMNVTAAHDSTHAITGTISSYNATTGALVMAESDWTGSGTFTSWTVGVGYYFNGSNSTIQYSGGTAIGSWVGQIACIFDIGSVNNGCYTITAQSTSALTLALSGTTAEYSFLTVYESINDGPYIYPNTTNNASCAAWATPNTCCTASTSGACPSYTPLNVIGDYIDLLCDGDLGWQVVGKSNTSSISAATYSTAPNVGTTGAKIVYKLTAIAGTLTPGAPTGNPVDGQMLEFIITDNGTAHTLSFTNGNSYYASGTLALPTTTVISTQIRIWFQYDSGSTHWVLVGIS